MPVVGRAIGANLPPERWLDEAKSAVERVEQAAKGPLPAQMKEAFFAWVEYEQSRRAYFDELRAMLRQIEFPQDGTSDARKLEEVMLDLVQLALDIIGIFEPTPFADLTSGVISAARGQWWELGISVVGVIPWLGDTAKVGKLATLPKKIGHAMDLAATSEKARAVLTPALRKLHEVLERLPVDKLPESLARTVRQHLDDAQKRLDDFFKKADPPTTAPNNVGRPWSKVDYDEWLSNLKTKPAPTTRPGDFQRKYAGDTERLIQGGGEELWADGIRGSEIIEAKLIPNPTKSPSIPGTNMPDFLRAKINAEVDGEFRRMAAIVNDPANPLKSVAVITNDARAVPFFKSLLTKYKITGKVVVKPE